MYEQGFLAMIRLGLGWEVGGGLAVGLGERWDGLCYGGGG